MTYRIKNITIAVVLALVAALLTIYYVSNYKRTVQQGEAHVRVYVAAKDIPLGASGTEILRDHLLEPRDVARRTVVPGAIADPAQVEKLVASQPVLAGEQVSLRRFATEAEQGVVGGLKGTQRAVQVPGDGNQLLAGTLQAGDRVDVVANITLDNSDHATRVVLRDLRVLQAPEAQPASGKVANPASTETSALVAVRDTQVQRLFWVLRNADWTLQLRPAVDASDSPEIVETTSSVLRTGLRRNR
jgi:Flp pilus assembly protein CpaB